MDNITDHNMQPEGGAAREFFWKNHRIKVLEEILGQRNARISQYEERILSLEQELTGLKKEMAEKIYSKEEDVKNDLYRSQGAETRLRIKINDLEDICIEEKKLRKQAEAEMRDLRDRITDERRDYNSKISELEKEMQDLGLELYSASKDNSVLKTKLREKELEYIELKKSIYILEAEFMKWQEKSRKISKRINEFGAKE